MSNQSEWPTRMKNPQRTGYADELFVPPLELAWKYKMNDYVWAGPIIAEGVVYIPGDRLYALHLEDGNLSWKSEIIKAFGGYTSVTEWQALLFACGVERLYIIDARDGATKMKIESRSTYSSPCVYQETVYWGTVGGNLHAADVHTGEIKWSYDAGFSIKFTPAALNGKLFCSSEKTVFALDAATGKLEWHSQLEGRGSPLDTAAIHDDILLVARDKSALVALDVETGKTQWQYDMELGAFTAPCVAADGIAYVASRCLHAVSCKKGKEIWTSSRYGFMTSAPIVIGEYIYIGGGNRRAVFAFDRRSGEKVWEFPTGDLVFSTPAYAKGRLIIGCHDGYIYCFKQA